MRQREKTVLWSVVAVGVFVAAALAFYLGRGRSVEDTGALPAGENPLSAAAGLKGGPSGLGGDLEEEAAPFGKVAVESGAPGEVKNAGGGLLAGKGVITGRVLAEGAGGLAGARVVFRPFSASTFLLAAMDAFPGEGKEKGDPFAAKTGPEGSFRLKNLPAAEKGVLVVSSENFVTRSVSLGKYGGGEKDVGAIVLELGGTVSGTVLSSMDHTPIPDAEIIARKSDTSMGGAGFIFFGGMGPGISVSTKSAPDGSFVLRGVPAGEVTVSARHEEHPPSKRTKIRVVKGRTVTGVNLELEPGCSISGIVTDTSGAPLPGIKVGTSVRFTMDTAEIVGTTSLAKRTKTGSDGSFTLKGLSKGTYTLKAFGGIYPARSIPGVATGTRDARIVLERGGTLLGHLFDGRTGRPLETFDLKVRGEKFGRSFPGRVLKGEDSAAAADDPGFDPKGAFCVEGIGEDPLRLDFSAPGCADVTIGGVTVGAGLRCEKDFTLPPEASLRGVLESPSGKPLAKGTLTLRKAKPAAGNLDVAKSGTLSRHVRLGKESGEPAFSVVDGEWSRKAPSAADGTFSFRGIPRGDFTLEASHDDYPAPEPLALTLAEGEEKTGVTVRMASGGAVTGRVYAKDGRPFAGASVRARRVDQKGTDPFGGGGWFPGGFQRTTADIDGVYAFKGIEPGMYSFDLEEKEKGPFALSFFFAGGKAVKDSGRTVMVKEGETVRLDLYEIAGGAITGYVTEAGDPVEGMKVQLFPAEGFAFMPAKTAVTDDQGSYSLSGIAPGAYKVRLALGGLSDPVEENVDVRAGANARRDFELPTGRITGRVFDGATGDPLKGVTLRLERLASGESKKTQKVQMRIGFAGVSTGSGEGEGVSTFTLGGAGGRVATDVEGCFEIRYVKKGSYRLVASKDGYIRGTIEKVAVREGRETARQNLFLFQGSVIRGRVVSLDDGKPAAFVAVRCERLGRDGKPVPGEEAQMTVTEESGDFTFKGLEKGTYRLSSAGSNTGETVVDVRAGKTMEGVVLEVQRNA